MLAAVVLASLWAQAEQAPPPPAPAPPPAPPAAEPPPVRNQIRVHGAFAYRPQDGGGIVTQAGFSVGGAFERRYLMVAGGGELGVAIDGAFTRFSSAGSPVIAPGQGAAYSAVRTLSQTSFAVLQTAGWQLGRVRPFVAAGAGVSIGYFSTPEFELRPGTASTTQAMARAMAGVDIAFSPATALIIRANYSHMFSNPTFDTEAAGSFALFGSLLDVGVGMAARF
jgi:hypothetical protein